jgi:hypothetical protein
MISEQDKTESGGILDILSKGENKTKKRKSRRINIIESILVM